MRLDHSGVGLGRFITLKRIKPNSVGPLGDEVAHAVCYLSYREGDWVPPCMLVLKSQSPPQKHGAEIGAYSSFLKNTSDLLEVIQIVLLGAVAKVPGCAGVACHVSHFLVSLCCLSKEHLG